ncbi:sulfate transporter [Shewanella sp. JM162201]|uniref:Sulfate transporter n=1 Tax=Shewanella jiangmenensis TaxID=2837387 RepID=A0ABS5V138_9GAMM|nr:putative sulfate/molybdate transporter [Shewanella jiangmenensis]MBT1444135.1 sulfate transporter [Shewanella jiangmenensis]
MPTPASRRLGDISGAFADLGTFLPLVLGLFALNGFSAERILLGFGLFALASAAYYRRPVPIQPMKIIAAMTIGLGLSPAVMEAGAMLMGIMLLVLALSGAITALARQLSQAVSVGLQLAIGLQLMHMGLSQMSQAWVIAIIALALLLFCRGNKASVAMVMIIAGGVLWQCLDAAPVSLPREPWQMTMPSAADWQFAALSLALPQLALTLTNAVIATSAMACEKFPDDKARLSPAHFGISSGLANLLLAPLGSIAMCHGAGGLAAQYSFGARTGLATAIFGAACLILALGWQYGLGDVLLLLPLPLLGAMLTFAGGQLAWSRRLIDGKPYCLFVIVATALCALLVNMAAGLALGLLLERGIRQYQSARSL